MAQIHTVVAIRSGNDIPRDGIIAKTIPVVVGNTVDYHATRELMETGVVAVLIDLVQGDGLSVVGLVCVAIGLSVVSMNARRKKIH